MKLNKLLFILLAAALSFSFVSCSDDDDDYSAKDLVGIWNMTADNTRVTTNNGKATELVNTFLSQNDNETENVFIFDEDGTFKEKDNYSDLYYDSGTYQVKGNKLYFSYDDNEKEDTNVCVISSLSENSLALSANLNLNTSLMDYLREFAEFGEVSIKMLEKEFETASIDMSTITVKEVRATVTYEKLYIPE